MYVNVHSTLNRSTMYQSQTVLVFNLGCILIKIIGCEDSMLGMLAVTNKIMFC
jgi:hypothetical protein